MHPLPEMKFSDEDNLFSGYTYLEYWQLVFGLNEPISFAIDAELTNSDNSPIILYNSLLNNQKELLDNIIWGIINAWHDWITHSSRAKKYKDLPAFITADDIINTFYPVYIYILTDDGIGTLSFAFEPKDGKLKMFNQVTLYAETNKNSLSKIRMELDNIAFIPAKYRSEKEEKWYITNRGY